MNTMQTLHIAGPADLATAVPELLGFDPLESLVLVGITGDTVTAIARLDLAAIAVPGVLPGLFRAIKRRPSSGVIAIVYTDTTAPTEMLAEPVAECARWAGLELLAAVRATAHGVRPLGSPS